MKAIASRRWLGSVIAIAAATVALGWALADPHPRLPSPLASDISEPQLIRDSLGRTVFRHFRAVEPGVLYTGTAIPTTHETIAPDGTRTQVYADQTAFEHLRSLNVRHVLSLQEDVEAFYREQGYLRHWSEQTGYTITASSAPVLAADTYGVSDRSSLHAAAELLTHLKGKWPPQGAVYVHSADAVDPVAIVLAAFEIWRNRGWGSTDMIWAQAERRFQQTLTTPSSDGRTPQQRRDAFRSLRRRLQTIAEL